MVELRGTDGDDVIRTGEGDDVVRAGAGDDTIHYERDEDVYYGGPGIDTVVIEQPFDPDQIWDHHDFIPRTSEYLRARIQFPHIQKETGDPILPFGYLYDVGSHGPSRSRDADAILLRGVELIEFEDRVVDLRHDAVFRVQPDFDDYPIGHSSLFGRRFDSGLTVDRGDFGEVEPLKVTAINGERLPTQQIPSITHLDNGSTILSDYSDSGEQTLSYQPGDQFLERIYTSEQGLAVGEFYVDQTISITTRDSLNVEKDVEAIVGTRPWPKSPFASLIYGEQDSPIDGGGNDDTIYGGSGDQSLYGGSGDDFIYGGQGRDSLFGGTGDDTLYEYDEWIRGDTNQDVLVGNEGDDVLGAGAYHDLVIGDDPAGRIDGEYITESFGEAVDVAADGHDTIFGFWGNDLIITGSVSSSNGVIGGTAIEGTAGDVAFGGPESDTIWGAHGNDSLLGGPDGDEIHGLGGDDSLGGGLDDDRLSGGEGDDILWGGATGRDSLEGGRGNDTLQPGSGNDFMIGGAGADVFWLGLEDRAEDTVWDFSLADRDAVNLEEFGLDWATLSGLLDVFGEASAGFVELPHAEGSQFLDITVIDGTLADLGPAHFIL